MAEREQRTCAYDRYCTTWMNITAYRPDFETCWQGVADNQEAPFVDSWRNVIESCVGIGYAEVLCVHAIHEVA
jgi:hypothetical protein